MTTYSLVTLQSTYAQTTSLFYHVKREIVCSTIPPSLAINSPYVESVHHSTETFNVCSRCTIAYGMQTTVGIWWKIEEHDQLLSWLISAMQLMHELHWTYVHIKSWGLTAAYPGDMATFYRHLSLSSELGQTRYLKAVHSTKCPWECLIL